jgi:hypothetical protein
LLSNIEAEYQRQKAMELEGARLLIGDGGRVVRRLVKGFVVLLAVVMAVGAAAPSKDRGAAPSGNGSCHVAGAGGFLRPDDRCTPGTFDELSRAEACRHKQRLSLPAAEKRRIARQYGFSRWSGRDGELDHRVPFFLGGRTEEDNLWPEAGSIPNVKDRLEFAVHARVCDAGSMTVGKARNVFLGDWTTAYARYVR